MSDEQRILLGRVMLVVVGGTFGSLIYLFVPLTVEENTASVANTVTTTTNLPTCPTGMILLSEDDVCIDRFEAVPSDRCPIQSVTSSADTISNLAVQSCTATSAEGVRPWTNVAEHQATALCARAGKRLPTPSEWYQAALGTPDTSDACTVDRALSVGTAESDCRSAVGAINMVGNAWEWVAASAKDGVLEQSNLPAEGYVGEVGEHGIATKTTSSPQIVYGNDYFWSSRDGQFPLLRGGYFDSGSDAGVYAVHAATPQAQTSAGIGFRCATDARVGVNE